MTIKAIETMYRDYRFRSRLEARWAVFFDYMNVRWEYEKQGYELPSGCYLPDFWLPQIECWVEIKGALPTDGELQLAGELATGTGSRVFVFHGEVPGYAISARDSHGPEDDVDVFLPYGIGEEPGQDDGYRFCICRDCGAVGIEFQGRTDRLPCKAVACRKSPHGDKGREEDNVRTLAAIGMARKAWFEHGEAA